jgi:hypothetical protein
MIETTGAPLPPATNPPNTNAWLFIIVGLVVLCCFCVGAIGLLIAFGKPILNELGLIHAQLPALIK